MMIRRISIVSLLLFYGLLSLVQGQQTVFNVPTTDVLDKGKVYFELDISAKPNNSDALNKFSSFVPRLVICAGIRVETCLNHLATIQPTPDSTALSPTVKWKGYAATTNARAVAVPTNLIIPAQT